MTNDKKLVLVEWTDAGCDATWQVKDSILTPTIVHTVGFLYHEEDTFLMITGTITETGDFNQTMTIPRGMVVSIKDL